MQWAFFEQGDMNSECIVGAPEKVRLDFRKVTFESAGLRKKWELTEERRNQGNARRMHAAWAKGRSVSAYWTWEEWREVPRWGGKAGGRQLQQDLGALHRTLHFIL